MDWGGKEELRAALEAMGEPPPPSPEIADWLMPQWRAWTRLGLDRPWHGGGMGPAIPGHIPWLTIRTWCLHHGIDLDFTATCLAAMDRVYIQWHVDRMEKP